MKAYGGATTRTEGRLKLIHKQLPGTAERQSHGLGDAKSYYLTTRAQWRTLVCILFDSLCSCCTPKEVWWSAVVVIVKKGHGS